MMTIYAQQAPAPAGEAWGSKGIIGILEPTPFGRTAADFSQLVPNGVGFLIANLSIVRLTPKALQESLVRAQDTAKLLAESGAQVIVLNGAFGMATPEAPRPLTAIAERLQYASKVPCTTGDLACVDALRILGVEKLTFIHPGSLVGSDLAATNAIWKSNWESYGFQVVNCTGPDVKKLGLPSLRELRKWPESELYTLVRDAYLEAPDADAVFVGCGAWGSTPVVLNLEREFKKPFISISEACLYGGFKALNIKTEKGVARIFDLLSGP